MGALFTLVCTIYHSFDWNNLILSTSKLKVISLVCICGWLWLSVSKCPWALFERVAHLMLAISHASMSVNEIIHAMGPLRQINLTAIIERHMLNIRTNLFWAKGEVFHDQIFKTNIVQQIAEVFYNGYLQSRGIWFQITGYTVGNAYSNLNQNITIGREFTVIRLL